MVIWISSLSSRVSNLEIQLKNAKAAGAGSSGQKPEPQSRPSLMNPYPPEPAPAAPPKLFSESLPANTAPAPAASAPKPRTEKDETEIATNWLNKIGVVAVLLGMGLFFKYAIDQNWITPWMRIIIGFIVGGLFVFLGWLWREKYAKYANVMVGGGVAIWYFTIFAAYDFYHLLPQFAALALMVLASLFSVFMAYYRQSAALAILGLIGAYGAPVALSSGENRQMQFLTYLSILNFAVLAILVKNYWSGLALFAAVATWLDYSFWYEKFSFAGNTMPSVVFFMLFFAVFFVGLAFVVRRHSAGKTLPGKFASLTSLTFLLVGFVYLVYMEGLLGKDYHAWMIWLGLFAAAAAFLAYTVVDRLEHKEVNYTLSFVGAAMLLFAFNWQWSNEALALSVLLTGGLGALVAYGVKRAELRLWSTLVLVYSLILVLALPYSAGQEQLFIFNFKFGLMALQAAAMFYAAWLYKQTDDHIGFEHRTDVLMNMGGILLLWAGVSWDIGHFFPSLNGQYGLAFWWIVYPLALAALGHLLKKNGLIKTALVLTAFSLVRSLAAPYPAEAAAFLFNFKFGLMAFQTAALFVLAKWSEALKEDKQAAMAGPAMVVVASVFLWLIVTIDIFHAFSGIGESSRVALWWAIFPVLLIFFAKNFGSRVLGQIALVLMVLGFFRVLFLDYDPENYLFILNAKFGLMFLEVLALMAMARLLPEDQGKDKASDFMKVTASLLLWFAFSWELVRFYNRPEDGNTRNLLMSLWWIAYAVILITVGALGKSPLFRKIAMALFGASILKVFLFDALALETGYRIVSFIVLGVILLSVSFAYQKNKDKIKKFLEGEEKGLPHV